MDKVDGVIDRVTYRSEDSLYTVAKIRKEDGAQITAVGPFPSATLGQTVRLRGTWSMHREYGRQFNVQEVEFITPTTLLGIEKYLGSGLIHGIGPVTAKRLVERFGLNTIDVIESEPAKLTEVPGIGPKKADRIVRAMEEHKAVQKVMVFLQSHGVSPGFAAKIYKHYGDSAIDVVSRNPYQLAEDIYGIGFKTADKIGRDIGIDRESPERVSSGIKYWLSAESEDGHCYSELQPFIAKVSAELEVSDDLVSAGIGSLVSKGEVFIERDTAVFLAPFRHSERGVAERLLMLATASMWTLDELTPLALSEAECELGLKLGKQQTQAVLSAFRSGVMVLTGGPGTGKTTTLKVVIHLFKKRGLSVALAAPTGRAAKRLSIATGHEAKTIHRLLEFGKTEEGFKFARGPDSPLDCDVLVVDEVSMMDVLLAYSLLKALKPGTRLILVGDADQLPSVGPGNVLRDIIASQVIEVVELDEIFRQATESAIIMNAHRINRGEYPILKGNRDFFFIEEKEPDKIVEIVRDMVSLRLPAYLKCDPVDDIQVLSPMRRTVTGVDNLNEVLREVLNPRHPDKPEMKFGPSCFRKGDKVMQIRNDYDRQVWNGDMGRIVDIDVEEGEITVRFPDPGGDRAVVYSHRDLDELVLSYCVSIHKSQGSEYPAVVVPITTQHYVMLQRNLIYTAITRARTMLVLVGTKSALAMAVRNAHQAERRTLLRDRLCRSI